MKSKRWLLVTGMLVLFISSIFAQDEKEDKFSYDLQLRTKSEYRNGVKALRSIDDAAVLTTAQRSRIGLNFSNDLITSRVSIQDVRVWGEESIKSDAASLGIHEAWLNITLPSNLGFKVGRQVLKYENQRLLAAANWNNVGIVHDMALVTYEQKGLQAHLGLAVNNDKEKYSDSYYPVSLYKNMQFLYLSKSLDNGLKLSLLEIADGYQDTTELVNYRTTTGLILGYKAPEGPLSFYGEAYYQGGKTVSGQQISAYMFSATAGYKAGSLTVNAGIDYFSGENELNPDNVHNSFNKLYGAGHKHLGYMDYFTAPEKNTKGGGLQDIYGKLSYKAGSKLNASLIYHKFSVTGTLLTDTETQETLEPNLGSEIDLIFDYKLSSDLAIQAGYCTMLATSSMEWLKGGDADLYNDWAFVMLTYKIKSK